MSLRKLMFPLCLAVSNRLSAVLQNLSSSLKYRSILLGYDQRDDDIFVVSYPKAGTTVIQMMLYQLSTDGTMDIPHIDSVAPWFESALGKGPNYLSRLRSPRIFKTHRKIDSLPVGARCIYIVREPKDTCVSYYHHLTSLHGLDTPMPPFVDTFMKGRISWGSWFDHLTTCYSFVPSERVLLISYDDIRKDLPSVVDKVAKFCGFRPDEKKRSEVVERCSIEFMKKHNFKFDPRFAGARTDRTEFIRKGVIGDWVNSLTPAAASLIDAQLDRTLEHLPTTAKRDLAFLRSEASGVRGTIWVPVHEVNGAVFLKKWEDDFAAKGIFVSCRDAQVLSAGERVQLRLLTGIQSWIAVSQATLVKHTRMNGILGCVFEFTCIEESQARALADLLFGDDTIARAVDGDLLEFHEGPYVGDFDPGERRVRVITPDYNNKL